MRELFLLGWSGCVLMRGRVSCVREGGSGRTKIETRSWCMAKKKEDGVNSESGLSGLRDGVGDRITTDVVRPNDGKLSMDLARMGS